MGNVALPHLITGWYVYLLYLPTWSDRWTCVAKSGATKKNKERKKERKREI